MKIFSVLAAFLLAFVLSTTAFAANWTEIPVDAGDDTKVYIDKSTLQRGIHSAFAKVNRNDGFSVKLKLEMEIPGDKPFAMINLIGFYKENGKKRMYYLEKLDENGNTVTNDQYFEPSETAADGTDGTIWPGIFDYLEKNLQ